MKFSPVQRLVAAGVSVLTFVSLSIALWPTVGWQTPEAHDHDVELSNQAVLSAVEGLSKQIAVNHDNWICDEIVEEMKDLREAGGSGSVKETQLLAQFEEIRCGRFSDLD